MLYPNRANSHGHFSFSRCLSTMCCTVSMSNEHNQEVASYSISSRYLKYCLGENYKMKIYEINDLNFNIPLFICSTRFFTTAMFSFRMLSDSDSVGNFECKKSFKRT